jgi:23S rRNA (uracil1939-C5)-methyltransferase
VADIGEQLQPSELRVEPRCPIYGSCGGCNWQHINYETQLEQKRAILAETLWRGARVPASVVEDIVAAPEQYGYRSRMQFKVAFVQGRALIGFYRPGSHQVVDAEQGCPVALPVVNRVMGRFRDLLEKCPEANRIFQLSINTGMDGVVAILQCRDDVTAEFRAYLVNHIAIIEECTGLFIRSEHSSASEKLWGRAGLSYIMEAVGQDEGPSLLGYPPDGFSQVNQAQNRAMLSVIRELGVCQATDTLLDLYCGNGNFSLPLAHSVASITGVEVSADSIAAAEQNRIQNHVSNAHYFCADVRAAVRSFVREKKSFDVILLDPPRAGVGEAVSDIALLQPRHIIYVSCDPTTLARDCGSLVAAGYDVAQVIPVDMFPQTHHIESITLLQKRKG